VPAPSFEAALGREVHFLKTIRDGVSNDGVS
jgi:hypothetical protein